MTNFPRIHPAWTHSFQGSPAPLPIWMEGLESACFHRPSVWRSQCSYQYCHCLFWSPWKPGTVSVWLTLSIFLEKRKQMAWGAAEWSWVVSGRGYRLGVLPALQWGELSSHHAWPAIKFWSGKDTDLIMENIPNRKPEFWLTSSRCCHVASLDIVSLPRKLGPLHKRVTGGFPGHSDSDSLSG